MEQRLTKAPEVSRIAENLNFRFKFYVVYFRIAKNHRNAIPDVQI
jgi:hypothetical protein